MFTKLKTLGLAAAIVVAAPVAAVAATISGQIDITGNINVQNSSFNASGNVDFAPDTGIVTFASGDFDTFVDAFVTIASLFDIDFTKQEAIWSAGGFTFTAVNYSDFEDTDTKHFEAFGKISGNGFDDTNGRLSFTSQVNNPNQVTASFSSTTTVPVPAAGLMLIAGLGGLVAARRRKAA